MITGADIYSQCYDKGICVKEKEIESIFNTCICQIYPKTKIYKTFGLDGHRIHTDGFIKFDNSKWILQECKRDIGSNSVWLPRAFLQSMCYLAKYYEEPTIVDVNKFLGIIIDSARFVCYISANEISKLMVDFRPMYYKYNEVQPSKAYIIPELAYWASNIAVNKQIYKLEASFRFDLFIKNLYNSKI